MTFTTTNWGTAQTVTVKAGGDDNSDNESETLAHTAFGGDYVNVTKDLPVTVTDDDDPQVTVSFGADAYTVPEGGTQAVTVTLSADPERTVVIPLTATNQGDAAPADYSVPLSVTFNAEDMSKTITFSATDDAEDDDGESVLLAFGTLPSGVSAGTPDEVTVTITGRSQAIVRNTDDQEVTVSLGAGAYTVAEGETQLVTVNLSTELEDTVVIPPTATNQYGATAADYSGVPSSVTFNSGETTKTFEFMATADDDPPSSPPEVFPVFPSPSDTPPPGPEGEEAFNVGQSGVFWYDRSANGSGNHLTMESCTGSHSLQVIWKGPDGNRRADEWAAHIVRGYGAAEVSITASVRHPAPRTTTR